MRATTMSEVAGGRPTPRRGALTVEFTSPGGLAVRAFADGAALVRVCAGHLDAEDGLLAEARSGAEPAPWASRRAREEAISELRRRARKAEGGERSGLVQALEHVRRTPFFEDP